MVTPFSTVTAWRALTQVGLSLFCCLLLLPPLTLSEPEAASFLGALDAVLADCHGAASRNWAVVRDIALATLARRKTPSR